METVKTSLRIEEASIICDRLRAAGITAQIEPPFTSNHDVSVNTFRVTVESSDEATVARELLKEYSETKFVTTASGTAQEISVMLIARNLFFFIIASLWACGTFYGFSVGKIESSRGTIPIYRDDEPVFFFLILVASAAVAVFLFYQSFRSVKRVPTP